MTLATAVRIVAGPSVWRSPRTVGGVTGGVLVGAGLRPAAGR